MRTFTLSFIACFFLLLSISAFSQKAYLPHGRTDVAGGITVFDLNRNAVATEIPIDNVNASYIEVSPDGSKAYAEFSYTYDPQTSFIFVIDTKTDKIVDTISMGSGAFQISSDGKKLYGIRSSSPNVNAVFVMNLQTKLIESTIQLPVSTGFYNSVEDIVLSHDESKLYVAESNTIQIVDLKTKSVLKTIDIEDDKYAKADITALALSPDGLKLYASDQSGQKVIVVNTLVDTISTSIPCGSRDSFYEPSNLIVSPDGLRVYTNNYYSLSIGVIDAVNN